jgi:hypothetical protein
VHDNVLPVVAEVVRVCGRRCVPVPLIEELRKRHLPPRHDWAIFWFVIRGNADRHHVPLRRVEQPELVEVVIQPAHCVLDGDV